MPQNPGQDDAPGGPQTDSVTLETFSGLRNTVLPERMGPRELARAVNVDIDDEGQMHLRQGRQLVATGDWHSLYGCWWSGVRYNFGVNAGTLCLLAPDFAATPLLGGLPDERLSWVCVAGHAYFSCEGVSGKIDLMSGLVEPWGFRTDHSYYPPTVPKIGGNFWLSPVQDVVDGLGPIKGKLLGPPPMGSHIAYFSGRIYIAVKNVVWATELYTYNYVDKTRGFMQFEDLVTGICDVEDGIYVGTRSALYFVQGVFREARLVLKERSGVVPGTMVRVPGALVDPEGRRRPDVPHESTLAVSCMTHDGLVVGFKGGQTYNLTRNSYRFPKAVKGAAMYAEQSGFNSLINVLESEGTPTTTKAAFGDYAEATLIRNGVIVPPDLPPTPVATSNTVTLQTLGGTALITDDE